MRTVTIYLSGGMAKFGKENFEEGNKWRVYCENTLNNYVHCFNGGYKVEIINPNNYYNFLDEPAKYISAREAMDFDLNKLRNSDLVICNFNDPVSLGTMSEIAIAYERRIPVIGLNANNEVLHDWQTEICSRIFTDIDEMLDYVEDFYLS